MKQIVMIVIAVFANYPLTAQHEEIDRFFEKYKNDDDFTMVSITPKMFSMFAKVNTDQEDGKKMMKVIQKLKSLRILANEDTKKGRLLYKEADSFLSRNFEELMTIHEKDNDLKFMVKENNGLIGELIMLIGSPKEFMAMSLVGDIDLNEISIIAEAVNVKGIDKLKSIKKK